MRQLFATVLILCMLVQSASKTAIYLSFLANQDYIAKNLCENRFMPEKKCCGKCRLLQELKKDEQRQGGPTLPGALKVQQEVTLIQESSTPFVYHPLSSEFTYAELRLYQPASPVKDIAHPPGWRC